MVVKKKISRLNESLRTWFYSTHTNFDQKWSLTFHVIYAPTGMYFPVNSTLAWAPFLILKIPTYFRRG